jgi:hypothetical protein
MLVFKAKQVVSIGAPSERSFPRKNGVMMSEFESTVTAIGTTGAVATIVFKRPSAASLTEALKACPQIGKDGEIPILTAVPLKAVGEFRASGIAYAA